MKVRRAGLCALRGAASLHGAIVRVADGFVYLK
jgi:hypothetical protein